MFYFTIVMMAVVISACLCKPEIPTDRYAAPMSEFLPGFETRQFASSSVYGPPQEYGPPSQKLITKNVYLHVPPVEESELQPVQVFEKQIPKKHYKIIFIKAPTLPTPTAPVIPETIPDEHKTLVYVLIKKPDPLPQIELPQVKPTEPSKPEVFFIKYKEDEKISQEYGAPSH